MTTVSPEQCHLWKAEALTSGDLDWSNFAVLETYREESHSIRRLLQCKGCGQLYFYEFYEEVDWEGGNDPQHRTLIPVSSEGAAEKMKASPRRELLNFYPRLQIDWPANAEEPAVKWVRR